MKKIGIILILLGSFTVSFAGILKYQVLKPATTSLPKDVKTLVFVYRNIEFKADSITKFYKYNEETYSDTTNYSQRMAKAVYWGFRSVVEKRYNLDTIPMLILDKTQGGEEREIPFLSWNKVDEICKKNNADVLVSLDDISVFNNYQTWYDGEEYNGVADITSFHSCTIYDPLTKQYLLHKTDLDSLQTHDTAYDFEYLMTEKLPRRGEIMETVAFSIGERIGKKIVPHWESVEREFYDYGNRRMREATRKVQEEKWQEALAIWDTVQNEGRGKIKARSAFNSAVIYERIGEIDKALVAIQQSINTYKALQDFGDEQAVAVSLQQMLQARKNEMIQLEEYEKEEE